MNRLFYYCILSSAASSSKNQVLGSTVSFSAGRAGVTCASLCSQHASPLNREVFVNNINLPPYAMLQLAPALPRIEMIFAPLQIMAALIIVENAIKPAYLKPSWRLWAFPAPNPAMAGKPSLTDTPHAWLVLNVC